SDHDMGGDIIPAFVARDEAYVYDFNDNVVPGALPEDIGYWRDVGTIDAFYDAHMDLVSAKPAFNLYNARWPIRGETSHLPPAKFINGGSANDSMVGAGCIVSGAMVHSSVLSVDVVVAEGAVVQGSILMPGVRIGRNAVVRNAILDKNVVVRDDCQVGVDSEHDREQYTVSSGGIVAVAKNQVI
ncbi:MAG: sugar phosphate nucleotidyltransferase, partial [Gordonia sp. (in: high G+C Gram-positive bacteria)]|uniref:sugar phosphate nucleotidyltransferase n=1 Tax=Gordonia sp. (in: high G+C Gram-positive bacteria) TaxID=84139 RepID=UPI003BB72B9E